MPSLVRRLWRYVREPRFASIDLSHAVAARDLRAIVLALGHAMRDTECAHCGSVGLELEAVFDRRPARSSAAVHGGCEECGRQTVIEVRLD